MVDVRRSSLFGSGAIPGMLGDSIASPTFYLAPPGPFQIIQPVRLQTNLCRHSAGDTKRVIDKKISLDLYKLMRIALTIHVNAVFPQREH